MTQETQTNAPPPPPSSSSPSLPPPQSSSKNPTPTPQPQTPPEKSNFTSIPTISLLPLFSPSSPSPSHLQSLAAEIHSACTTTGFFYATDHGIPLASQTEIFAVMEKFFRQVGEKEKMQEAHLHLNPAMRGYEPLGETGRGRRGGEYFFFLPLFLDVRLSC